MYVNRKSNRIPSYTSPKSSDRGCLCEDNTYNIHCCDGSLQAQGLGVITKTRYFLSQENNFEILLEDNSKIIIQNG